MRLECLVCRQTVSKDVSVGIASCGEKPCRLVQDCIMDDKRRRTKQWLGRINNRIKTTTILLIIGYHTVFAAEELSPALCHGQPDGSLLNHPDDCNYFVECYNGYPYEKRCGLGLHFNKQLGICDYPGVAGCNGGSTPPKETVIYTYQPPPPPPQLPPQRESHYPDVPAYAPQPNYGNNQRFPQSRPDPNRYEETVYGNIHGQDPRGLGQEHDESVLPSFNRVEALEPSRPPSPLLLGAAFNHRLHPQQSFPEFTPPEIPEQKSQHFSAPATDRELVPLSQKEAPDSPQWWDAQRPSAKASHPDRSSSNVRLRFRPIIVRLRNQPQRTSQPSLNHGQNKHVSTTPKHRNKHSVDKTRYYQNPRQFGSDNNFDFQKYSQHGAQPQPRQPGKIRNSQTSPEQRNAKQIHAPSAHRPSFPYPRPQIQDTSLLVPSDSLDRPVHPRGNYEQGRPETSDHFYDTNDETPNENPTTGANKPPPDFNQFPFMFLPKSFMGPPSHNFLPIQFDPQQNWTPDTERTVLPVPIILDAFNNTYSLSPEDEGYLLMPLFLSPVEFLSLDSWVPTGWLDVHNSTQQENSFYVLYPPELVPFEGREQHGSAQQSQTYKVLSTQPTLKQGLNFGGSDYLHDPYSFYPEENSQFGPPLEPLPERVATPLSMDFLHNDHSGLLGFPSQPFHGENDVSDLKNYISVMMRDAKSLVHHRLSAESRRAYDMRNVVSSPSLRYVSGFLDAKPVVKMLSRSATLILQLFKLAKDRYHMDTDRLMDFMNKPSSTVLLRPMQETAKPDVQFPIPPDIDYCPYPERYTCDPSYRYRSHDGSCHNLAAPIWGRAMIPFRRFLPAYYDDGVESMRQSVVGGYLPSARTVSLNLFPDSDIPHDLNTLVLVEIGQFLDHDLTHTAITEVETDDGSGLTEEVKCGMDGCETESPGLESCWPIHIPDGDPDFGNKRCLTFVRSQEVPRLSCKLGPREQMNQVTSWMDASMIYGSSKEDADKLRDLSDPSRGRMAVSRHPKGSYYKPLLPHGRSATCDHVNATVRCFEAGDIRVNEQNGLTVMHTIWVREHNRIEAQLHRVNPHWSGDRLYHETRHIVAAIIQHITYNEVLPVILGPQLRRQYGLVLEERGYFQGHDPNVEPTVTNSFATAAFRFGHTLIHERIRRADPHYNYDDNLFLSSAFRNPTAIYETGQAKGMDAFIRGIAEYPCQAYDTFFTKQISRSLFTENPPFGPGMDLLSLNIQRGRDHGIPGYNAFREACGLRRAHSFDDLANEIPSYEVRARLQRVYRHVDDIDLFAGGVAERSVHKGVIGPTFGCIIADQFRALRKGDRFWYENKNEAGFTPGQLEQIRKIRLSRVMCVNTETVTKMQPWILYKPTTDAKQDLPLFDQEHHEVWIESSGYTNNFAQKSQDGAVGPDQLNPHVPCDALDDLDLSYWAHGPYTA